MCPSPRLLPSHIIPLTVEYRIRSVYIHHIQIVYIFAIITVVVVDDRAALCATLIALRFTVSVAGNMCIKVAVRVDCICVQDKSNKIFYIKIRELQ